MFITPAFVLIELGLLLVAGALLGALAGWLLAWLLRPAARNFLPDALLGSASILVGQFLYGSLDNHVTFVDGRALGTRGLVLNHVLAFRVSLLLVAVLAWRVRMWRRAVGQVGHG